MAKLNLPKGYHPDFQNQRVKPLGSVEIDWDNPITKNLLYYFVWQDGQPYDLVSQRVIPLTTEGTSLKHDKDGAYAKNTGRSQADSSYSPLSSIGTGGVSILSRFRQPTTDRETVFCSRVGNNVDQVEFRSNSDANGASEAGGLMFKASETSDGTVYAASAITGEFQNVIGIRSLTAQTLYSNGLLLASDTTNTDDLSGAADFVFGGLPGITTIEFNGDRGVDAGWSRSLTDAESKTLTNSPYQILKPKTPAVYYTAGASGSFTLVAETAAYAYSGANASLLLSALLGADTAQYTYAGQDATLTFASAGNFTLTADTGAYVYTGTNADLLLSANLDAETAQYTYSGPAATLTHNFNLTADTVQYTYSGTSTDLVYSRVLDAENGAYTYTGTPAALTTIGDIWTDRVAASTTWTDK